MPEVHVESQSATASPYTPSSSPLLRQAARNSVFSGLGTVATFVLSFIFAGLTIRYLGEARGGYFMVLQALLGLNLLLLGYGLGVPAVRRVAVLYTQHDLSAARSVIGSVLVVNVSTTLPIAVLIIIFFPDVFAWSRLDAVYEVDAFYATLLVCASFMVSQFSSSWQTAYQSLQRYDLISGLNTLFGLMTGVAGIIALRVAPSMTVVAATGLGVAVIRCACDAYFMHRLLNGVPLFAWHWSEVRPMLSFGGWTYLGTIGGFLFTNVDRLILTTFMGSAVLPYYVLPQRLQQQVHTALIGQSEFLFPMFSALGETATAAIQRVEDRLRWYLAVMSGMAYTSLLLIGPFILSRLVDAQFAQQATIPLALACIQGFLHAQMIVPYFNSWAIGRGAPNTIAQLANGVLVVVTAIVLIPRVGYIGASIAQLWIGVIFVLHSVWVRRLVLPQSNQWSWLQSFVSPCVMIAVWLLIFAIGMRWLSPGPVVTFILIVMGGMISLGAVWAIESVLFPACGRWSTLVRATKVPLDWLKGRVAAR